MKEVRTMCSVPPLRPGSHCSWCGNAFMDGLSLHQSRQCGSCQQVTYANPLPVVVGLIYKEGSSGYSVLGIRRAIQPCKGELALIGGFLESGEMWEAGLSREVQEEVGISIPPESWKLEQVFTVLSPPRLIVTASAACPKEFEEPDSVPFDPQEVQQVLWLQSPTTLCFSSHTESLHRFFAHPPNKEPPQSK